MPKKGSKFLDTNDEFPVLNLKLIDGQEISYPENKSESYSVIFFYRGSWWPSCVLQLVDYQNSLEFYNKKGVSIYTGSTDSLEDNKKLAEKHGITYPVAYGLDAEMISEITGAYYDLKGKFIQPTGFIIRPNNRLELAVYSSGPVGRLMAKNALNQIKYSMKK